MHEVLASVNGLFSFRDLPGSSEDEGFCLHVIETWIFGDMVRLRILLKSLCFSNLLVPLDRTHRNQWGTLQSHLLCETPFLSSSFLQSLNVRDRP